MNIRSVALLGAGAVGAYFIYGFTHAKNVEFCVIADGDRKDRLEKQGITINDAVYHPPVKTPGQAKGVDLLLIATKYDSLKESLSDIRNAAGEDTIILSLLNGVDSEEIIGTVVDPSQIIYSYMKISSQRIGSSVYFDVRKTPGLYAGEGGCHVETERLTAIRELFADLPIHYHFCEDILADQWKKYALNISYNLPQAILGVGVGAYNDSMHVNWLREQLEMEVRRVAAAYGITFGVLDDNPSRWLSKARFSTLQDLDAGRHTEVDMFCGTLVKKAEAKGMDVPYVKYTWHMIKALEEKSDGLFDYG